MTSNSPVPKKSDFLIVIPDHPGVLEKRMEVRPQHFADLKAKVDSGTITFGGAILEEVNSPNMQGSAIMVSAESKEEAVEIVKADIYYQSGVWDLEKAQIYPFKTAIREPLNKTKE